jgi:AcrR family transcriptional regulator
MNARSPAEPGKLRDRLREATAAAILDAAEDVFAERGLSAAHMNEIAARAGVAVGTLYNHFKDRDALLMTLLDARRDALLEVMDQFLEQPSSGSFETDLKELMRRMGGYFDEHRRFHHILHQLDYGIHQANYPVTAQRAPYMKKEMLVRLDKLMKRGLKLKALRPEMAEHYPTLLLGILRSLRMRLVELDRPDEKLPIDEVVRFFIKGAGV